MVFSANLLAAFLLLAALYLAYQAGAFEAEEKEEKNPPPVILFALVTAVASYLLMLLT